MFMYTPHVYTRVATSCTASGYKHALRLLQAKNNSILLLKYLLLALGLGITT